MASSSYVDNYDVFINFRGADTRQGFVHRLYDDLVAEGMHVFVDDEELNYGKRLDEELPQAINNSKIYITIISQTYASSKWCLRELAEIVRNKQEFKDKKEILPVFYKINTDDVKLKTDLFNNQLNSLIGKKVTAETVEEWSVALKGMAHLKAWKVPIDGGYKVDGEFCREIVKRALIILRVKHKPLPKDLIGMDGSVEEVMQLLDIGHPGLQVIGIHGMGGSGKTTLAKVVYNKLCDDQFDCGCFLPNVRESLEKDEESRESRGCLELQAKLLKDVSYRGKCDEIRDIEDAVRKIQCTLERKKVLLVFDDISKSNQIMRLIGNSDINTFNRGSRIIITTRDEQVLRSRELTQFSKIHQMKAMEDEHALELFSWHAFGQQTPPEEYSLLSNDAVSLTGRLPLSLEITGSLFYTCGRKSWQETLEKLKRIPNKKVHERLKISYENLDEQTREIFLDIACFFVDKLKVTPALVMWYACDMFPWSAIEKLISMCLLTIDTSNGDIFKMHDHIKDLGREIVRQEGPKDKEQRSRIWNKHDAINILTASKKKENNKIEGILLDELTDGDGILTLKGKNCVNLDMLRFLHLEESLFANPVVQLVGSFKDVLPNLRWLSLPCMKMKRFKATNFNLKKLIVLDLSHSDITESWAMFKELPSLEVLYLTDCPGLKKTPDFSYCKSLKTLNLRGCSNLEEIDPSITNLSVLQILDLGKCTKLKKLPDSIGELVELKVLLLDYCDGLVSLPNSLTRLPKLYNLSVYHCTSLRRLPDSVGEMVLQLTKLEMSQIKMKLPRFISKQKKLEVLIANYMIMPGVPEIEELSCLRVLSFNGSFICGLPSLAKLTRLRQLSLKNCNQLKQLPTELPTSLVQLHVSSSSLQSIPDYSYLIDLTDLELELVGWKGRLRGDENGGAVRAFVRLDQMKELKELNVKWIWGLSKLNNLQLNFPKCTTTIESDSSVSLAQLEQLTLHCSILGTCVIPSFLFALRRLNISLYKETTTLYLPRLNRLKHLLLSNSDDLAQILGLGELESLVSLEIIKCNSLEILDDISKLKRLLTLKISKCKKLRVISVVPCQPSLKELVIIGCESLQSLVGPSEESESQTKSCLDDLHRFEDLKIVNCPLLEEKLHEKLEKIKGRFLKNDDEDDELAEESDNIFVWSEAEEMEKFKAWCLKKEEEDEDEDEDEDDKLEKAKCMFSNEDEEVTGAPNTLLFNYYKKFLYYLGAEF